MYNVKTYIESGILEMFVMGVTTGTENNEVLKMAVRYPAIQNEIEKISTALYDYMHLYGTEPPAKVKSNLLEVIRKR